MPTNFTLISQAFEPSFYEGVGTTENLAANVAFSVIATQVIDVTWIAESSEGSPWNFSKSGISITIQRSTGSFLDDGFFVGSVCELKRSQGNINIEFTINSISGDGKTINATAVAPVNLNDGEYINIFIQPLAQDASNLFTALIHGFGIIGNDETYNNLSKVTQNPQEWYGRELTNVFSDGLAKGNYNDWVTGQTQYKVETQADVGSLDEYTQRVTFTHEFIVLPYFVDGELENLQNRVLPELFKDNESLKYAYKLQLRQQLSNPNKEAVFVFEDTLGSVGWFDINFNGFDNDYEVESVVYQDAATLNAADSLQILDRTKCTITVSKLSGAFAAGQRAGVAISLLPNEERYTNTANDFKANFLYDALYHNEGTPAEVGTGIIKSFDSSISGGNLIIEIEIKYTVAQQLTLSSTDNYLIAIDIGDLSLSAGNSDRVSLIADVTTYQDAPTVEGLIEFTEITYGGFGQDFEQALDSTIELWNQDDSLIKFEFDIDTPNNGVLTGLTLVLAAYNTVDNTFFELDSYAFDLSTVKTVNDVQEIDIFQKNGRGYVGLYPIFNAPLDTIYGDVRIVRTGNVGGKERYFGYIGQKIKWQEWLFNNNVPADVFFNGNEPNDNLNFKTSNYSNISNYQIKAIFIADSTGTDAIGRNVIGRDVEVGGNILVRDFGESDGFGYSGTVQVLNPANDANLGLSFLGTGMIVESRFTTGAAINAENKGVLVNLETSNNLGDDSYQFFDGDLVLDGLELVSRIEIPESFLTNTLPSNQINITSRINDPLFIFEFQTNWNTAIDGNFTPTVTTSSGTVSWQFGTDPTIFTTNSPVYAGPGLDGNIQTVKIIITAISGEIVTGIVFDNLKIVGTLNLKAFQFDGQLIANNNPDLTVVSNIQGELTTTNLSNCNLTGLSFVDVVFNGDINTANNNALTTLLTGGSNLSAVNVNLTFCDIDNIDLRNLPLSGQLTLTGNNATILRCPNDPYSISQWIAVSNQFETIDLGGLQTDNLTGFFMQSGIATQSAVDDALIQLDNNAVSGSIILDLSGTNPAPSAAGIAAKNSLISKGYTVNTN